MKKKPKPKAAKKAKPRKPTKRQPPPPDGRGPRPTDPNEFAKWLVDHSTDKP
ncbi:MAG: hypothetical protein AABZ12_01650 [Planctomycetota bacterium]